MSTSMNNMLQPLHTKPFHIGRLSQIDTTALVRERSEAAYSKATSGKPDPQLMEDCWHEFERIMDLADDTARMDAIEDTTLQTLIERVCERRAKQAIHSHTNQENA